MSKSKSSAPATADGLADQASKSAPVTAAVCAECGTTYAVDACPNCGSVDRIKPVKEN